MNAIPDLEDESEAYEIVRIRKGAADGGRTAQFVLLIAAHHLVPRKEKYLSSSNSAVFEVNRQTCLMGNIFTVTSVSESLFLSGRGARMRRWS